MYFVLNNENFVSKGDEFKNTKKTSQQSLVILSLKINTYIKIIIEVIL